jgi:hypothetical protein
MMGGIAKWFLASALLLAFSACDSGQEPTKASESEYNEDITKATTSYGLTKADLAWHANNTFGWDYTLA